MSPPFTPNGCTSWYSRAVATYRDEIDVPATAQRVWAVLLDVERWPQWTPSMTAVQLLTPGPLAMNSQVRVQQPRLPAARWTVEDFMAGRSFAWTSSSPGTTSRADHAVIPTTTGCHVEVSLVQTGPLAGLLSLGYGRLVRRYLQQELHGLRQHASGT